MKISGLVPFPHGALDINDQQIISLYCHFHSGLYPNEELCREVTKLLVMRVGPLLGRAGFSRDKTTRHHRRAEKIYLHFFSSNKHNFLI